MGSSLCYLHLADSAFPLGGFAFSSGLESMVKHRLIGSLDELLGGLQAVSLQLHRFELSYLRTFSQGSPGDIAGAWARLEKQLYHPLVRRQSEAQGAALVRLLPELVGQDGAKEVLDRVPPGSKSHHFVAISGFLGRALGFSEEAHGELLLYTTLRDQVSAALRLGLLGPQASVKLQQELYRQVAYRPELVPHYSETYRTTMLMESALFAHDQLYTTLFQN